MLNRRLHLGKEMSGKLWFAFCHNYRNPERRREPLRSVFLPDGISEEEAN